MGEEMKEQEEEEGDQKGQRSLECLSELLGISLGRCLEASWDVWGVSWRSGGTLGRLECLGEAAWGSLGGLLEASWGHLGAILAPLGASRAPLGAILEAIDQRRGCS